MSSILRPFYTPPTPRQHGKDSLNIFTVFYEGCDVSLTADGRTIRNCIVEKNDRHRGLERRRRFHSIAYTGVLIQGEQRKGGVSIGFCID